MRGWLVFFSGLAVGAVLLAAMEPVSGTEIPVGKDTFTQALPRILAAVASGLGATVIVVGALWSLVRLLRHDDVPGRGRLAAANALVALGTLVLSSGGLVQGFVGHDEAFALSLAVGIAVIYAGFLVADGSPVAPVGCPNRSIPTQSDESGPFVGRIWAECSLKAFARSRRCICHGGSATGGHRPLPSRPSLQAEVPVPRARGTWTVVPTGAAGPPASQPAPRPAPAAGPSHLVRRARLHAPCAHGRACDASVSASTGRPW